MIRSLGISIVLMVITLLAGCQESKTDAGSPNLEKIQTSRTLLVGTAGDMPPFNMTTSQGDVIGFEADLAQNFADSLDLELRFEKIPFSELLTALIAGKIQMVMSSMTIVPQRNA
jgi:ABC-type amino acid transport substrate-binding protein